MVVSVSPKVAAFSRTPDFHDELSAMQVIAVALEQLEDQETRLRVLRWATERFCRIATVAPAMLRPVPVETLRQSPENAPASDDGLSVSTLGELFIVCKPRPEPVQSTGGMLREFVAEFQDVVHEWNAVCASETQSG